MKLATGMKAESFKKGSKLCVAWNKILPMSRFTSPGRAIWLTVKLIDVQVVVYQSEDEAVVVDVAVVVAVVAAEGVEVASAREDVALAAAVVDSAQGVAASAAAVVVVVEASVDDVGATERLSVINSSWRSLSHCVASAWPKLYLSKCWQIADE